MADTIKQALTRSLPVVIDHKTCQQILTFCYMFETTGSHPEALNTPLLGVAKIYFLDRNKTEFFDIFHTQEADIKRLQLLSLLRHLSARDVKKILNTLQVVNTNYRVQSDSFNMFVVWVLHLVSVATNLDQEERYMTQMALLKILQYKFFTSVINHDLQHGATPAVIQGVIASLSKKFDIVQYGTWKKVIEARAADFLQPDSIHYRTIYNFHEDLAVFYLITDISTRITGQMRRIISLYYNAKKDSNASTITSYSTTGTDIDGKKIILNQISAMDAMTSNICGEILNLRQFINNELITAVCKLFKGLNVDMFRRVLIAFSNLALYQAKVGKLDEIRAIHDNELYLGSRVLIANILQKSYRHCLRNQVNLNNKLQILQAVRDAFSSSRINDPDILQIRDSVVVLVDSFKITTRNATKASIRIAFILYILIKSFEYL